MIKFCSCSITEYCIYFKFLKYIFDQKYILLINLFIIKNNLSKIEINNEYIKNLYYIENIDLKSDHLFILSF